MDDIRPRTYAEEVKGYNEAMPSVSFTDPDVLVKAHGLKPYFNVNSSDYPVGTKFLYPKNRPNGATYILRG